MTRTKGRDLFVGGQIVMSAFLLLVGGLFVRSFQQSLDLDLGFRPEDVVLARTNLGPRLAASEEKSRRQIIARGIYVVRRER